MMRLFNGQQRLSWKIVVSLIFCTIFLTACKNTNETNAGICNGEWALVGGYLCWGGMPGDAYCILFGRDNDRDGAFRSGTSDTCIVDELGNVKSYDCDKMCREFDCSKAQCPAPREIKNLDLYLNTKKRVINNDPLKAP